MSAPVHPPHALPPHDRSSDRLKAARWIGLAAMAFWVAASLVVGLHQILTTKQTLLQTLAIQKAAGLSTPAWFPSGRTLRIPAGASPAVDLRFSPRLPRLEPAPPLKPAVDPLAERAE